MDYSILEEHRIIPVVVARDMNDGETKISALHEGGIMCAEITMRTDCACQLIAWSTRAYPDMLIGAGTVVDISKCREAIDAGARFVVSPGLDVGVFNLNIEAHIPYLAGAVTPTEIMNVTARGADVVKYFPANIHGGVGAIKALSAVFPELRFVPTGGVDLSNMREYLSVPSVMSVGGSFMLRGSYDEMVRASLEAMRIVEEI